MIRRIGEGGGNNNSNNNVYDDDDVMMMNSVCLMYSRHRRQHKEVCIYLIL